MAVRDLGHLAALLSSLAVDLSLEMGMTRSESAHLAHLNDKTRHLLLTARMWSAHGHDKVAALFYHKYEIAETRADEFLQQVERE